MPYPMTEPQYEAVVALDKEQRSTHFLGKVADGKKLWAVKNKDGWLAPVTAEGNEYFPVWPHAEFAQRIADKHFPGYQAAEISLSTFLSYWVPTCDEEYVKIAVFPDNAWQFAEMEPQELAECLIQQRQQQQQKQYAEL